MSDAEDLSRRMLAAMETIAHELPKLREEITGARADVERLSTMLRDAGKNIGGGALLKGLFAAMVKK